MASDLEPFLNICIDVAWLIDAGVDADKETGGQKCIVEGS